MEKLSTVVMLFSMMFLMATAHESPNSVRNWYRKLPSMKQKVTELNFFLHDIVSGPNATNIPIAMANFTTHSPTYFGLIAAMDDPLTVGPGLDSAPVGRAQGVFISASLHNIGYHMAFNFVFTTGKYNGSTISVMGHNPFMSEYRELPIIGGSGVFRLARGTAVLDTVTFNSTSGDAIVEYHVVVLHY